MATAPIEAVFRIHDADERAFVLSLIRILCDALELVEKRSGRGNLYWRLDRGLAAILDDVEKRLPQARPSLVLVKGGRRG